MGYENVNLMKSIFRLDYLNNVVGRVDGTLELVALGLHDTTNVFSSAQLFIPPGHDPWYVVKVHPRSGQIGEFRRFCMERKISIVEQPLGELLPKVKRLIVTYSSLGMEAKSLGIPVEVIDVPGKINILDIQSSKITNIRDI